MYTETREMLKPGEAAAMLRVHVNTLAEWRRRGQGPPARAGGYPDLPPSKGVRHGTAGAGTYARQGRGVKARKRSGAPWRVWGVSEAGPVAQNARAGRFRHNLRGLAQYVKRRRPVTMGSRCQPCRAGGPVSECAVSRGTTRAGFWVGGGRCFTKAVLYH